MPAAAGPVSGPRSQLHQRPCIYPIKSCMQNSEGTEPIQSQIQHTEPSSKVAAETHPLQVAPTGQIDVVLGAGHCLSRGLLQLRNRTSVESKGNRGKKPKIVECLPQTNRRCVARTEVRRGQRGVRAEVVSLIRRDAAVMVTFVLLGRGYRCSGALIPGGSQEDSQKRGCGRTEGVQGGRGGWRRRQPRCCKQRTKMAALASGSEMGV